MFASYSDVRVNLAQKFTIEACAASAAAAAIVT